MNFMKIDSFDAGMKKATFLYLCQQRQTAVPSQLVIRS